MENNQLSIKSKLLRILLVTSGVVLFLTCSAFFAYEFFTYRQSTKDQLLTLGKIVATNSTAALVFESETDASEILQALKAESHIVAACLYDHEGNVFARYPTALPKSAIPLHPGADGYNYTGKHLEGYQPVTLQGKQIGTLYLRSDLGAIYNRFKIYGSLVLFVILFVIGVAYLLSRRLQRTISEPILALAETAKTISTQHDYTVRARKFYDDELGQFSEAFNQMLSQIERQNAEITHFNHDLERKVAERTTALENTNAELILKNELVETIIDSSVDVILVFDRNFNFLIINKYAAQWFGLGKGEVEGKNLLDVFPTIKEAQLYKDLEQALLGKLVENRHYNSHISDKILENFYVPLFDQDGQVYRILVIGHDITQSIRNNEKLSALNNQLAVSNRDLEQFAYIASHDLQEPLRKIQTYASLIEQDITNAEATATYLTKLIASVVRMRELINSILNYSQVSNSGMKLEKIDLNTVIDNIKVDFELALAEKRGVIETERLPAVEGDHQQLSQLFYNLISNSLKFSKKEPHIIVSATLVQRSEISEDYALNGHDRYAKISVQDNGIGFDQQFAAKVFVIFQRFHSKHQYPGTGIGLALCKKIVENHKGAISVNSVPNVGTTFSIYLPV